MDKQKQIEKLTKELDYCETHDCIGESCSKCRAIWLIENGYRKIPEGSVVLSKEEYEDLKYKESLLSKTALITKEELLMIYDNCNQARKETAEKILQIIDGKLDLYRNGVIGGTLYDAGYMSAVNEIKIAVKNKYFAQN